MINVPTYTLICCSEFKSDTLQAAPHNLSSADTS